MRGTVSVAMLSTSAQKNGGHVTPLDYIAAVIAGGTVESIVAGIFIEIPETRIQSGLSRFSIRAINCFPFILARNIGTTIAPAYIITHKINDQNADVHNNSRNTSEMQAWSQAIAKTLTMSTAVAIIASPLQGVAARVIQEQSVKEAWVNTKDDFMWENKSTTLLRVLTRALYTGITGCAITTAYLVGEKLYK